MLMPFIVAAMIAVAVWSWVTQGSPNPRPTPGAPVLELFLSVPIVIPFKYMLWVSLESLLMEIYYFTAFAKKASRIGQYTNSHRIHL